MQNRLKCVALAKEDICKYAKHKNREMVNKTHC